MFNDVAKCNRSQVENQGLFVLLLQLGRIAEARQRYEEYLDRFPWGEHTPEALAALERLGAT